MLISAPMQVLSSAPMEMTKTVNVHAYMQVKKSKIPMYAVHK